MSKLKSLILTCLTLCLFSLNISAQSDSKIPPKPLDNKVYDAMVGTWTGESNMMGTKMHDVIKIHWAVNHQFIVMELISTKVDQPSMKYEGMGVFGVDAQGKAKTWWFDSWGADSASTGSGDFSDNKLTITDGNGMFNETRSFEISGNTMTMHAQGSMTWQGKKTPFEQTTVYKKQ